MGWRSTRRGGLGISDDPRSIGALVAIAIVAALAVAVPTRAADTTGRIERVRVEGAGSATKVVITLSRPLEYDVQVLGDDQGQSPRRLVLDFSDATLGAEATKPIPVENEILRQIRTGQFNAKTARVVVELGGAAQHTVEASTSPPEVTIAFAGPAGAANAGTGATQAPAPALEPALAPAPAPAPAPPSAPAAVAVPMPTETSSPSNAPGSLAEGPRATPRAIPIRARGRRPYSLNYKR